MADLIDQVGLAWWVRVLASWGTAITGWCTPLAKRGGCTTPNSGATAAMSLYRKYVWLQGRYHVDSGHQTPVEDYWVIAASCQRWSRDGWKKGGNPSGCHRFVAALPKVGNSPVVFR